MDPRNSSDLQRYLAWLRYLYWAELARQDWDDFAEGQRDLDDWVCWWGSFARMSRFYAAEYVVIEGWREARFSDSVIDEVLNRWPDLLDLLRRFRNGVFHFQPKILEPKFIEFLKQTDNSTPLVYYLHSEFCRYYWTYVDSLPGSSEQRSELRELLLTVVGWIPEGIVEAKAAELRQVADDAVMLTQGHGGSEAGELRNSAAQARILAEAQAAGYRKMCRAFLSRNTKVDPQDGSL